MKPFLSDKSKELQAEIDHYLDWVENASLIFFEGVRCYMQNKNERFERLFSELSELESQADDLRRKIKYKLYTFMLIPEARGDVLGLLENMDTIIDTTEKVLEQLSIETPNIPDFLRQDFIDLAELSRQTVCELVKAARAFFTDIKMVNNYINKVHFYEHQADDVEEMLKRKLFKTDQITRFSFRVHLRFFTEKIASVSDEAEEVGERLSVYAIKRRM
jgi:hypothetical protein